MFDSIADPILDTAGKALAFFYGVIPNYAVAIVLMTILVMIITTPLTLKGTRGMIKMQLLQPELKKIQEKHKGGDRQEMNAELMAFYQDNGLNPLGGCLPLLIQAPVFLLLFNLIKGMTRANEAACGEAVAAGVKCFDPKHLDTGSNLYQALHGQTEMKSFGLDLAESTSHALGESIIHGLPYLMLILLMIGGQYVQQKQVSARNPDGQVAMPQQKILLRVMPVFFGFISINFPTALVIYWVTSNLYRIGLQTYITRSLYAGEDSIGAKANKAAADARALKDKADGKSVPKGGAKAVAAKSGKPTATRSTNGSTNGKSAPAGGNGKYQPASKKKKKRR